MNGLQVSYHAKKTRRERHDSLLLRLLFRYKHEKVSRKGPTRSVESHASIDLYDSTLVRLVKTRKAFSSFFLNQVQSNTNASDSELVGHDCSSSVARNAATRNEWRWERSKGGKSAKTISVLNYKALVNRNLGEKRLRTNSADTYETNQVESTSATVCKTNRVELCGRNAKASMFEWWRFIGDEGSDEEKKGEKKTAERKSNKTQKRIRNASTWRRAGPERNCLTTRQLTLTRSLSTLVTLKMVENSSISHEWFVKTTTTTQSDMKQLRGHIKFVRE